MEWMVEIVSQRDNGAKLSSKPQSRKNGLYMNRWHHQEPTLSFAQQARQLLTYQHVVTSLCSGKPDQAGESMSKPIAARPTFPYYGMARPTFPKNIDWNFEDTVLFLTNIPHQASGEREREEDEPLG
jgi:hypothetical protein